MSEETLQEILQTIPECTLVQSGDDYLAEDFDIVAHVDKMYAGPAEKLARICKDEYLAEEMATLRATKEALVTRFYKTLKGMAQSVIEGPLRTFRYERTYRLPLSSTATTREDEIDQLAILAFISELRRKKYIAYVTHTAQVDGSHLRLGRQIHASF